MFDLDDILLDRYKIFGYREGGMGVVYFVKDLETDRNYAAKTFKSDSVDHDALSKKFRDELDFSLSLGHHPNLLRLHSIEIINDQPFLFSDYISGGDLQGRIRGESFSLQSALNFAHQIATGMEFFHSHGQAIHLDLKPTNILITEDGVVKISDFGLAREANPFLNHPETEHMGAWPYMSPEQFLGEVVDTRSDIYSFGIILYEMLVGRFPFEYDFEGKNRSEIYEYFKTLHTSHEYGEAFYWHGIPNIGSHYARSPSLPEGLARALDKENALGIIVAGCITRLPPDRFYNFEYIREAIEFSFPHFISTPYSVEKVEDPDVFTTGLNLQKIEKHSEALRMFNKALKKDPKNPEILYHVAKSLWMQEKKPDAIRFLEKAISLHPDKLEYIDLLSSYKQLKE